MHHHHHLHHHHNCQVTPTTLVNSTVDSVTVTVGGPILRGQNFNTNNGLFSQASSNSGDTINLNASAIVASSDCCSNVMSFEETKQLLAKHLQETTRRNNCCNPEESNQSLASYHEEANFDGIDLGGDDQTPVALGDILEKLEEETTELVKNDKNLSDYIRLHSEDHPTISATVNVATLDLSDPESIHAHLSQLNDTVLRVTAEDNSKTNNPSSSSTTTATSTSSSDQDFFEGNQDKSISISISSQTNVAAVQTESNPILTISKPKPVGGSNPGAGAGKKSGSSGGSKASPQSCSVCSKVFSNASALAKHRLTHSEERRYHCNICGKAFKRQDHLNGHLLTHRSTKPFACHVEGCGKSYCDARSLRRHKENHHGQAKPEKQPDNQELKKDGVLTKNDTKIKFSSKGLTAQQLQLIEQLFKQSSKNKEAEKQPTTQVQPPPLNANVVKRPVSNSTDKQNLPDKPVECTICNRKFKNIPALNGHMRLHGGYYKKDADGRRMVGISNRPIGLQQMKRKSTDPPQNNQTPKKTISVTYCQPTTQQTQVTSLPSFAFSSLPQPDTSKLLANLEQKANLGNSESTSTNTTTTSSLRALRKPQAAKKQSSNNQAADNGEIASLINTQPLSLPMVALPTKPVPVNNNNQGNTSIQITALIQSNPINNGQDFSSSMQDISPMTNNIPLVTNMLSCMQHSIPIQHSYQVKQSNLLKPSEDKTPKIGTEHQADLPELVNFDQKHAPHPEENLLWDPSTAENLTELELNQYLLIASSCVVNGGSHNEEVALEILQKEQGNIQNALQELLSGSYELNSEEDSLSLFSSQESDSEDDASSAMPKTKPWQPFEVDLFYEGLVRYHKDFNKVAKHVGSKSVKDCVEFYYLWKNICLEESQSFKSLFSNSLQTDDNSSSSNSSLNGQVST